jgi:hypothetical protein
VESYEQNFSSASEVKQDSITRLKIIHSPGKAALFSAVLPGFGQLYNKKYWKIPVIYAGFGTLVYFIVFNNNEYQRYRTAFILRNDNDPLTHDEFEGKLTPDELKYLKDEYRRYRDLNIIMTAGLYALNIIDANVDAHFFDYDISPDLSLKLEPAVIDLESFHKTVLGTRLIITF